MLAVSAHASAAAESPSEPNRRNRNGRGEPGQQMSMCHNSIARMARISAPLERRLRSADPGELVDIVIELQTETPDAAPAAASRPEHYSAAEHHFASAGQHVHQFVRDHGGEVIGSSWLAGAIRARVPAGSVSRLQSLDHVDLIDVPRALMRD